MGKMYIEFALEIKYNKHNISTMSLSVVPIKNDYIFYGGKLT